MTRQDPGALGKEASALSFLDVTYKNHMSFP